MIILFESLYLEDSAMTQSSISSNFHKLINCFLLNGSLYQRQYRNNNAGRHDVIKLIQSCPHDFKASLITNSVRNKVGKHYLFCLQYCLSNFSI